VLLAQERSALGDRTVQVIFRADARADLDAGEKGPTSVVKSPTTIEKRPRDQAYEGEDVSAEGEDVSASRSAGAGEGMVGGAGGGGGQGGQREGMVVDGARTSQQQAGVRQHA